MTTQTPRFTVFARPAADGHTPEFVVMDGNVSVLNGGTTAMFKTWSEAFADCERREQEARA